MLAWASFVLAQGYYLKKARHFFIGSPLHEVPLCAIQDGEGFLYIGGYAQEKSFSLSDGWLVCSTQEGNILWQIHPGGLGPDRIEDIAVRDSVLYFCGSSGSALSHPEELPVERRSDFWVGAVEKSTGRMLWQRRWGSPRIDMSHTLVVTSYRTLIVGGVTWEDSLMGMQGVLFLLRAQDGEILQKRLWGHPQSLITKIRPVPNSTYLACLGEQRYIPFLAGIDAWGQVYWRIHLQSFRFPSRLRALSTSEDGRIWIGGQREGQWSFLCASPEGRIVWEQTWPDNGLTGEIFSVASGAHPEILHVLGWQYGDKLVSPEQRGDRDIWLSALSAEGKILWERGLGGPYAEEGVALLSKPPFSIIIAAKQNTLSSSQQGDAWVVVLEAVPCSELPLQARTSATAKERAGSAVSFWVETRPGYELAHVSWDFGDGTRAEGKEVQHTFGTPGTYIVQAIVGLKYGCAEVYLEPLTVRVSRP